MWTAILVDDEKPALQLLGKLVEEQTNLKVVGAFTRGAEALEQVVALQPDVAFLDVEMPGMNGLELASELTSLLPQLEIVFVTAYKEYALEAFRVHAIDYLLKPVGPAEIARCWERLKRLLGPAEVAAAAEDRPARMYCFGRFELYGPGKGEAVRFSTSKVEELLAFMITHGGASLTKWEICEQLWPEAEPERAESSLYTAVYRLKKSFVEHGIHYRVEAQKGSYRLLGDCSCDLIDFERMAEELSGMGHSTLEDIQKVFTMYRGPLFDGKDYSWSHTLQERMKRKYALLGRRLACAYMEQGAGKQATDTLLRLIEHDAFDEESYELLLEMLAHLHDRATFLQEYDKYKSMLEKELGLKVKPRMRELRLMLLEQE
ncbi:response regulator [Paenibacillus koleovorans]|uniref:response regulator n=1 Tax=Paenibacillus koleovorans TaxID=121608 RepID=UPI000FDC7D40|nr:response regulator [Paenibacillus koleovorans]